MLSDILEYIFTNLQQATLVKNHPFKYACLATISKNTPQQRMLVIRGVSQNTITIYTDSRTQKVSELKMNPKASLLFYDTENSKQLRLNGVITVNENPDATLWKTIPAYAKKEYTTALSPGSNLQNASDITYNELKTHFCILNFSFSEMDYLSIGRTFHTRAQFKLKTNKWKGIIVVP